MRRRLSLVLILLLIVVSPAVQAGAQPALAPQQVLHLRLVGLVTTVSADTWQVRDTTISVDQNTLIDETAGTAGIGAWVLVMATFHFDGSIYATKIQTLVPASQVETGIEFSGPIEAMNADNTWVVGGEMFYVDPTTVLSDHLALGVLVRVTAKQVDGALHATIVDAISDVPGTEPVDYTGHINSIGPTLWVIDNKPVLLDGSTTFTGDAAAVGKLADVQALLRNDGTLLAQVINVQSLPALQSIGAYVLDTVPGVDGTQTLNLLIFPDQAWSNPTRSSVQVTGRTFVDQRRAVLGAGQWVDMRARPRADGSYDLETVRVDQPAHVTVQGTVQPQSLRDAGGTGWWSLDGHPVWADPGGAIVQSVPAGGTPFVDGVLLGNGVILASRLQESGSGASSSRSGPLMALSGLASWSAPTPIVSSLSFARRPVIVTTPDGVERAVWESNGYIYYAHSMSDGSWSPPKQVVYGTDPAMVDDPSGNLHLVYANYWMDNDEIFYIEWQHGQWGNSHNISNTTGSSRSPDMAYSPDGSLQATWTDVYLDASGNKTADIYLGNLIGTGTIWGSRPVASATGEAPVVSVAPDGLVYIAWQDDTSATSTNPGNFAVWITQYRRVNGFNQFAIPVNLSDNPSAMSIGASIVAGGDGQAHVTWVENGNLIRYAFGRDTRWETPVAISQNASSARGPRIAFDHGAFLNIVWDEGTEILTTNTTSPLGPWSAPMVIVSQPPQNLRDVALNAVRAGGFVVGWVESGGSSQVGIYESSRPSALKKVGWLPIILH
jgi:hypothetical protein